MEFDASKINWEALDPQHIIETCSPKHVQSVLEACKAQMLAQTYAAEEGNRYAPFLFKLNERVLLTESEEEGVVIGRAEYAFAERAYLIRYRAADGRQVEAWWGASTIAPPVDFPF